MGKKKSKSKAELPPPVVDNDEDQADLAAALLAEMGLENEETNASQPEPAKIQEPPAEPTKKRNRRKEKLAQRELERAKLVAETEEQMKNEPNKRELEIAALKSAVANEGLVEHEIKPDGHCLFSSISDQLETRYAIDTTIPELRSKAAEYIRTNADDFAPYLLDEETGELGNIDEYADKIANTSLWGGDLEIIALSRVFQCPIRVFMASQPMLVVGREEFPERTPLSIAYYRNIYGLGAHYNSLREINA